MYWEGNKDYPCMNNKSNKTLKRWVFKVIRLLETSTKSMVTILLLLFLYICIMCSLWIITKSESHILLEDFLWGFRECFFFLLRRFHEKEIIRDPPMIQTTQGMLKKFMNNHVTAKNSWRKRKSDEERRLWWGQNFWYYE